MSPMALASQLQLPSMQLYHHLLTFFGHKSQLLGLHPEVGHPILF